VPSKRATNGLSAGFSFVLFLLCSDWLVVGLAGGDLSRLPEVLRFVCVRDFPEPIDKSARFICKLIASYMLQDIVVRIVHWHIEVRYVIHHLACLAGIWLALNDYCTTFACVALAISEFSTPIVCLFEVAFAEKGPLEFLIEPCGIALNILIPIRLAWFVYCFYAFVDVYNTNPDITVGDGLGLSCSGVLVLINATWYWDLLSGTLQALRSKTDGAQNAKAKAA